MRGCKKRQLSACKKQPIHVQLFPMMPFSAEILLHFILLCIFVVLFFGGLDNGRILICHLMTFMHFFRCEEDFSTSFIAR